MILNICENGDILNVIRIVKICITALKISIPIILLLSMIIDFMKVIKTGSDDLLSKTWPKITTKCIAAILVFLIPTFLNLVLKITSSDNGYFDCLASSTSESIDAAYKNQADKLISAAEKNLSYSSYYSAVLAVKKIKDKEDRGSYEYRLKAVNKILEEKEKEKKAAEEAKIQEEFSNRLSKLINAASSAGYTIGINNGYRSHDYQACLWNCHSDASHRCNTSWVACPGSSNHEFGLAADLNGTTSALSWAKSHASSYGLDFPLSNENWHIEPINISGSGTGDCSCHKGTFDGKSCSQISTCSVYND